jgi:hypothetical protein
LIQFLARAAVMLLVMAVVMPIAIVAGSPEPLTIALAIGLPGLTGMFWVARSRRKTLQAARRAAAAARNAIGPRAPSRSTLPDADAPFADPEASMPRWRRPSLQLARKLDPSRAARAERDPVRFGPASGVGRDDLRMVRYAVVPLLDWPDEVLGERKADLGTGDEVRVLGARGAFLEVESPEGMRGWIHRTTVGPVARPAHEAEDVLAAMLTARGIADPVRERMA